MARDPAMTDPHAPLDASVVRRRRGARRTAAVLGAIAIAVYVAFILAGVLAR